MFGQLLPEQANAPDSATTYGFAGPVTGTLPPLLSHQLVPNLGHAIKGPFVGPITARCPSIKLSHGLRRPRCQQSGHLANTLSTLSHRRAAYSVPATVIRTGVDHIRLPSARRTLAKE